MGKRKSAGAGPSRVSERNARLGQPDEFDSGVLCPDDWFRARWSGSHLEDTSSGWSGEGVNQSATLSHEIHRLRIDNLTGESWNGT